MKNSSFNLIFFGLIVIALDYCYDFLPTTYFYMGVLFVFLGISSEVFPYLSKIKRFSKAQIQQIDSMDGIEFEEYMAYLLDKCGYQRPKITQKSGDQGIDIIATQEELKIGFQCKRWKKKVGNKAVQEVYAGIGYYSLDKAIVITNSYYTASARQLAKKLAVELWDRNDLIRLIENERRIYLKNSNL
ncbi:restriction endonuclease [Enterococcus devriesei]|uniref:restriction endonuclease n=1 Tax=Enterococcus devriesei TaxID=319970 RepID=UPI0028AF76BC|nr:restriction endonuclease [Enterococcus devriesei]